MKITESTTPGSLLAEKAKKKPLSKFLTVNDRSYTYREIDDTSNSLANSLMQLGIKKGDKLCVLLSNSLEHFLTYFASAKIGSVLVPINTSLAADQLADIMNGSDGTTLITESDLLSQVELIQDRVPGIKTLVVCGKAESGPKLKLYPVSFDRLLKGPAVAPQVDVSSSDLSCLLFTSGTTGMPKGAMLSHSMCMAGAEVVVRRFKETGKDVFYETLPLYHVMGQLDGILCPLISGASVVLAPRFSLSRYWSDIDRYNVTRSCLTGAQTTLIFQQPLSATDSKHGLKLLLSFPVPVTIVQDFEKRFNLYLRSIYGLTEALMPLTGCYEAERTKPGSLGKPTDYEVRIADDFDNQVPDNTIGNLIFRPKMNSRRIFDGYYKMQAATAEMMEHCWVHSGDMAYRDADGYFWYAGRKKDVIRFRGENISTPQLEGMIGGHPDIKECTVIGVPSAISEEDIKALVVIKAGSTLKPEQLLAYCESKMPWFMVPRYVEFVDDLPKSSTDKVQKTKLKQNWKTPGTWDREAAGYKLRKRG